MNKPVQSTDRVSAAAGLLVDNEFLTHPKFVDLRHRLIEAAAGQGMNLVRMSNVEVASAPDPVELARKFDFILFWDKDLRLGELLELSGVPMFNRPTPIADCDDKAKTYLRLRAHSIAQPKTVIVPKRYRAESFEDTGFVASVVDTLGLPMVAKPAVGSFGNGVRLLHTATEVVEFLVDLGTAPGILQAFIAGASGTDYRLQVVGTKVVAAMKRAATDGDFRANLTNGGVGTPHEPTPEQAELALDACRALGLSFGGVDILVDADGRPLICEVNSNAHFLNLESITGIDVGSRIFEHILGEIQR